MAEAIYLLRISPTLRRIDLEIVEIGPPAARQKEAGRVSLEFEVLQIVVVTGQVEICLIFAEERIPSRTSTGWSPCFPSE
jgi:hypothetical protein